jgi:hypothetical protein
MTDRDYPVVDRVPDDDPTLLPRDPDGTEAEASAEAEYRAGRFDGPAFASSGDQPGDAPAVASGATVLDPDAPPPAPASEPVLAPDAGPEPSPDATALEPTPLEPDPATLPPVTSDAPTAAPVDAGTADVPASSSNAPSVAPSELTPAAVAPDETWLELQGQFVDDPQGAVRGAAELLEKAVADLRRSLEASDSTEDLRTAFRRYRDMYRNLR